MAKIVEVIGNPDSGKSTSLIGLSNRLTKMGISNDLVLETRGKNLFPKNERGTLQYNMKVGAITLQRIKKVIDSSCAEVLLVDKGYIDYLYFVYYYLWCGKCSKEEATYASQLFEEYNLLPNNLIAIVCKPEIAVQRCEDAVETRTVKVQKSLDCLMNFYSKWFLTPKDLIDTSFLTREEVVDELAKIILS